MRHAEDIKKLIKNTKIRTNPDVNKAVLNGLLNRLDKAENIHLDAKQPNIWRIIMKSSFTKLAAAAAIILLTLAGITIFEKMSTPAYAIEQTIQASHNVQYLHIKSFMASIPGEPAESWVEFDQSGQVKNIRFHKPAWMDAEDGNTVIVWKDNKAQSWIKKKNVLITITDKGMAAGILSMVEQINPKNAVENILKAQEQGVTKVEINEPQNKANPIVITADLLKKSDFPFQRVILFVDQATRLVNSLETYQLKDGQYIHFSTLEFYDYDMPIDPKMFILESEVPADAMRVDQTTQEVGLAQGNLTKEEIAVKVVREFYEALIVKDYAKAGQIYSGLPAAKMQERWQNVNVLRIVSISEPIPHPFPGVGGFQVHCEIEIEKDGVKSILKPYGPGVRPVHGQPHRWNIHGGVD